MNTLTLPLILGLLLFSSTKLLAQWQIGGNNLTANERFGSNTNYSVIFETNNTERARLTNAGLFGIGTTTPNTKVHVNSSSGQSALRAAVNGSTKLLVHSGGGTSIGSSSTPPSNGLFVAGNAGFGTTNLTAPIGGTANYKVRILHGEWGFNLQNSFSGNHWELWTSSSEPSPLSLFYNGSFVGSIDPNTGAVSSGSDERLKTNIKAMPSVLEKVNQLKPATYHFKNATTEGKATEESSAPESYGFLAQDVKEIFPSLVTHHVVKERGIDTYTLDYSAFGVIAIKAIQELQQTNQKQLQIIDKQKQKIDVLEDRIAKIEAALDLTRNSNGNKNSGIKELDGVSLEQNFPNPFGQITTFRYNIPTGANAQILIYDVASGSLVKTIPAPASGQAQLNAYDLRPGIYSYTLVVNGQVAASKKLVLEK